MALKLLQSGKLLAQAFQNLRIRAPTSSLLDTNQTLNPVFSISRNFPGFFTKGILHNSRIIQYYDISF